MWEVEYRVYERYPILDMAQVQKKKSGFDFIPEADREEINIRLICQQFGLKYEEVSDCRYSDYLRWVARYKAYHYDEDSYKESEPQMERIR